MCSTRRVDWETASKYFDVAICVHPSLVNDLDLFYELALGNQPPGFRGSGEYLDLEKNADCVMQMLESLFVNSNNLDLRSLKNQAYGTACWAIGLAAYNIRQLSLSRRYLLKAMFYRQDLWLEAPASGNFVKSIRHCLLRR